MLRTLAAAINSSFNAQRCNTEPPATPSNWRDAVHDNDAPRDDDNDDDAINAFAASTARATHRRVVVSTLSLARAFSSNIVAQPGLAIVAARIQAPSHAPTSAQLSGVTHATARNAHCRNAHSQRKPSLGVASTVGKLGNAIIVSS